MNPIKYRMKHKTMKPQIHMNELKVEVELHRNTKTSTNMGSPERKQNQGNEENHTRKRAHVKAEVVHEDGTSSQPHRCNDRRAMKP